MESVWFQVKQIDRWEILHQLHHITVYDERHIVHMKKTDRTEASKNLARELECVAQQSMIVSAFDVAYNRGEFQQGEPFLQLTLTLYHSRVTGICDFNGAFNFGHWQMNNTPLSFRTIVIVPVILWWSYLCLVDSQWENAWHYAMSYRFSPVLVSKHTLTLPQSTEF